MPDSHSLDKLRIAVTGFDGFIGSWFVKKLRSLNIPVIRLAGDVRSADTWKEEFDVLYHFAAMMPKSFTESPEEAFSVNVNGVLQALGACRRNNAQMVFISTCGVYKPKANEFYFEDDDVEPQTAYAQSKLIGEMLCRAYVQQFNVKSTIFRLFNVYGLGQNKNYIIPYLIKCALTGETAEVCHPDSSRDFVYISDVIDALMLAVKIKETFSCYNVGFGKSYMISQVIDVINEVCSTELYYKKKDSDGDKHLSITANVSKIAKCLNWSAKTSFQEGISQIKSGINLND